MSASAVFTAQPSLLGSALRRSDHNQALWDAEYGQAQSIPSSLRPEPAHALSTILPNIPIARGRLLDLGAGNGRHSFLFASLGFEVTALDFSNAALGLVQARAIHEPRLARRITPIRHDLYDPLPFPDSRFDVVLDAYCLCHITNYPSHLTVLQSVRRVLRAGGVFVTIQLDSDDRYYKERLSRRVEGGFESFDPINGFTKVHVDHVSYLTRYGMGFEHVATRKVVFSDMVRGTTYARSVFGMVLRKA